jgi:hypothetical protein
MDIISILKGNHKQIFGRTRGSSSADCGQAATLFSFKDLHESEVIFQRKTRIGRGTPQKWLGIL